MTEEEAEERVMVDVTIAAMHEEEYKEYGFLLPDNEPNLNAVEVRATPLQLSSCEDVCWMAYLWPMRLCASALDANYDRPVNLSPCVLQYIVSHESARRTFEGSEAWAAGSPAILSALKILNRSG